MTETVEITITGVLSSNFIRSIVDFYPLVMPTVLEEAPSETGWSHEVMINYTYDLLNRLTQASYNHGRVFDYNYDAVGNVLTHTVDMGPGNPVVTNYQYDVANRVEYVDE